MNTRAQFAGIVAISAVIDAVALAVRDRSSVDLAPAGNDFAITTRFREPRR